MSWNKFLSFYRQSVCNSLKPEPCSALALAHFQNDPRHPLRGGLAGARQTGLCSAQPGCSRQLSHRATDRCAEKTLLDHSSGQQQGVSSFQNPLPCHSFPSQVNASAFPKGFFYKNPTTSYQSNSPQSCNIYYFLKKVFKLPASVPTAGTRKLSGDLLSLP